MNLAIYPFHNDHVISPPSETSDKFLSWKDRPLTVVDKINSVFEALSKKRTSNWRDNGSTLYQELNIHEHYLAKKLIVDAYPNQKEFNFLELGSGNFEWQQGLCDFINNQRDLPADIQVNIIGTRGESGNVSILSEGKCKVYKLTTFKVENLTSEFKKLDLNLEDKVDLAISSWCFRHLVDPVGTFQQTYDLLRPKTGFFIVDGFCFLEQNDTYESYLKRNNGSEPSAYMINLMVQTKAPFLLMKDINKRRDWSFILNRPNEKTCRLPFKYQGECQSLCDQSTFASGCFTKFDFGGEIYSHAYLNDKEFLYPNDNLSGNKSLYNMLRNHGLIFMDQKWNGTLFDPTPPFPLHQAVYKNDIKALEEALKNGADIDEADFEGYTPLHLAVKEGSPACVKALLEKGASPDIPDFLQRIPPLRTALAIGSNQEIVSLLQSFGASINYDAEKLLRTKISFKPNLS